MTPLEHLLAATLPGGKAVARVARPRLLAAARVAERHGLAAGLAIAREELRKIAPVYAAAARDAVLVAYLTAAQVTAEPAVDRPRYGPAVRPRYGPRTVAQWVAQRGISEYRYSEIVALATSPDAPVRFPAIRRAADWLARSRILGAAEMAAAASRADEAGDVLASDAVTRTYGRVRQALTDSIETGGTLNDFRQALARAVDGSPLAPHHVETVYRTNLGRAYTAGMLEVLDDPLVGSAFPYIWYTAVGDDRTRPNHRFLANYGLQNTGVYRADDHVILRFWPPWAWNCVPGETPVLTSRGAVRIEEVRKGDVVLTHRGRWRAVVGVHRSEGPAELVGADLEVGRVVRATGNHRVLTQRGWVEMAALNVQDYLYQVIGPTKPDLVGMEVEHNAGASGSDMAVAGLGRGLVDALYFDPDGQVRKPEIQPERRERVIELVHKSGIGQRGGDSLLVLRHPDLGVQVLRRVGEMGGPPRDPGHRLYSRAGENPLGRGLGGFPSPRIDSMFPANRLGQAAPLDLEMGQNPAKGSKFHPGRGGEVGQGDRVGSVRGNRGSHSAGPVGFDLGDGSPQIGGGTAWLYSHGTAFRGVRIRNLRSIIWNRQTVFNLSVDEDESYVAGGVVMHNCRCVAIPLSIEDAAARGVLEAREWLRTGYPPANPEYVAPPSFDIPAGWVPVSQGGSWAAA